MNIFVLDKDPVKAAQLQCDKHVVKMIVESAQMLSTTHRMLDGIMSLQPSRNSSRKVKRWTLNDTRENVMYKAVHMNHPCTVWTRETSGNYRWHYAHFLALCDEYTHRYGKVHATDKLLRRALMQTPKNIPEADVTQFALAMKAQPQCIHSEDPVKSYREFYQTKQDRFSMVWTKRQVPEWFVVV
jgi:hypothetical protein